MMMHLLAILNKVKSLETNEQSSVYLKRLPM